MFVVIVPQKEKVSKMKTDNTKWPQTTDYDMFVLSDKNRKINPLNLKHLKPAIQKPERLYIRLPFALQKVILANMKSWTDNIVT